MLYYLRGRDLGKYPILQATMFSDRRAQFKSRLGWDVRLDSQGWEIDEYDKLDPLYVIWEGPDGRHGGSMRFLPTQGRTMVNEHFSHLLPQQQISDERIWETTRFCIADGAASNVSAALMLGGAEVGRAYNLTHAVGVFDQRMIRIYRRLAWLPQVIGSSAPSTSPVSVGLWQFSEETRLALAIRAGVPKALSRDWFSSSREGKSLAA